MPPESELPVFLYFVRLWYRFTMAWTRWRKPTARIPPITAVREIPERIRGGDDYRPDPRFMDYLAHPQCYQARLDAGEHTYDCEDHATYWAVLLRKSGMCRRVGLGFVYWFDAEGKRQAHAVCVFEDHLGGRYWADYHMPVPITPGSAWWSFGPAVLTAFSGRTLRKVAYLEITGAKADDTPIFRGAHVTKGHWFRNSTWP